MARDWPWSRLREVKCPDGTTQYVFKNIDHAFPFFFKQAKISTAAVVDGLKKIRGKLDAKYESEISHILTQVDEKNGTVQAHLRAAYVLYASAPCKKLDYLQDAIESVRQDENNLRSAELALGPLVTILSSDRIKLADANFAAQIGTHLGNVLAALSRGAPSEALVESMARVETNVEQWRQP